MLNCSTAPTHQPEKWGFFLKHVVAGWTTSDFCVSAEIKPWSLRSASTLSPPSNADAESHWWVVNY